MQVVKNAANVLAGNTAALAILSWVVRPQCLPKELDTAWLELLSCRL
jgi:hypothetical protein